MAKFCNACNLALCFAPAHPLFTDAATVMFATYTALMVDTCHG